MRHTQKNDVSLPTPEEQISAIREIEKKIGRELPEISLEAILTTRIWPEIENGYARDENGNIVGLNLSRTYIADITDLRSLTRLTSLDVSGNRITDFASAQNLTELTRLNLSSNRITDISVLRDLTQLTTLDVHGNNITDISTLQNLTQLTTLDLRGNRITDFSILQGLAKLTSLKLSSTHIADISILQDLTQLTNLDLSSKRIADFVVLQGLTKLTGLNLSNNHLTEIAILRNLVQLISLDLSDNRITDIAILRGLKELTYLDLHNNNIKNIYLLQGLIRLTKLDLHSNNIADITILRDLTQLTSLDLSGNRITDFSILQNLRQLTNLKLSSNRIANIAILQNLTQLTSLDLRGNRIADITILRDLTQLTSLDLSGNRITDISALRDLAQLTSLDLSNNPITKKYPPLENERDPKKIFAYLQAKKTLIARSKVLFLGEGFAGKTEFSKALLRKNVEERPDIREDILQKNFTGMRTQSTEGSKEYTRENYTKSLRFPSTSRTLGVKDLQYIMRFPLPQEQEALNLKDQESDYRKLQTYPLHIFDFGGQKMQQVLHRYFISPAFVCIFFRSTTDVDEAGNNLKKWLKRIKGVFDAKKYSEEYHVRLRIIVTDINNPEGHVTEIERSLQPICADYGFLNKKIFLEVDSQSGEGIEDFMLWIRESIEKLELSQSILPEMEALWKDLEEKNGTYQKEDEIFKIIEERHLGSTDQEEFSQEDILNYLCETTDVFKKITILEERRVYFTKWLLDNMYKILHRYIENKTNGERYEIPSSFRKDALRVLIGNEYREVIEVLEQIDFLVSERMDVERYFVPELAFANYEEPELLGNTQKIHDEDIHYFFDFSPSQLPSSLISSFFAKLLKSRTENPKVTFGNRSILVKYGAFWVQLYEEEEALHIKTVHNSKDEDEISRTVQSLLRDQNEIFKEKAHCDYADLGAFLDDAGEYNHAYLPNSNGAYSGGEKYFLQWEKGWEKYKEKGGVLLKKISEDTEKIKQITEGEQREKAVTEQVKILFEKHWISKLPTLTRRIATVITFLSILYIFYLLYIKKDNWNDAEPLEYTLGAVLSFLGIIASFNKWLWYDSLCENKKAKIRQEIESR